MPRMVHLLHMVDMVQRERESEREREREELVTFLGQIPGKMWKYTHTSVTYDMVHDTHDADDTYSQDSWSHFGDKFLGRCGNTQIHLLHMIEMVQRVREGERETEREREREREREKKRERERACGRRGRRGKRGRRGRRGFSAQMLLSLKRGAHSRRKCCSRVGAVHIPGANAALA